MWDGAASGGVQTLGSIVALCEEDEKNRWPVNGGSKDAEEHE